VSRELCRMCLADDALSGGSDYDGTPPGAGLGQKPEPLYLKAGMW
jgi:hypothetical protein